MSRRRAQPLAHYYACSANCMRGSHSRCRGIRRHTRPNGETVKLPCGCPCHGGT